MSVTDSSWRVLVDTNADTLAARVRELKPHEEAELFDCLTLVRPCLIPVVRFAMIAGLRKAAVIGLSRKRIDWVNMEFTVLLKTKGKKKREHVVPLTPKLVEIIKAQPEVEGTDRVFTYVCRHPRSTPLGEPIRVVGKRYPFTLNGWAKDWHKALKMAGVVDFRFHDLRHTAITRVVRKTGNLKLGQELAGHQSITMTSRYAHANKEEMRRALAATEELGDVQQKQLAVERRRRHLKVVA